MEITIKKYKNSPAVIFLSGTKEEAEKYLDPEVKAFLENMEKIDKILNRFPKDVAESILDNTEEGKKYIDSLPDDDRDSVLFWVDNLENMLK